MPDYLDLVARLRALEGGRAVLRATHLQLAIQPHARILCGIAMAAENATIHIVAWGRIGRAPQIRCVPDPRDREEQYTLFQWLGWRNERYIRACRRAGTYPQLWVSSVGAAEHLDLLAERFRFNAGDTEVERFGALLSYACERFPIAGEQALIPATKALRAHFATGQEPGEDEHLGTLLTWINPPSGMEIRAAIERAERMPMGHKTRPEFDRDVLGPLVAAYGEDRRGGTRPELLARHAQVIQAALETVVRPIYDGVQNAIRVLQHAGLPPLPELGQLEQRELEEFNSFMQSRDAGYHLPLRDGPKAAAFKLSAREDAEQVVEAAVTFGDRLAQARGILTGRILCGRAERPLQVRVGVRRFEHRFDVVSDQSALRLRVNDELVWLGDPRLRGRVAAVHREGTSTRVSLIMTSGQLAVGLPRVGDTLLLAPNTADWGALWRERRKLRDRLAVAPWTHADAPIRARAPRAPISADPLADVEAFR